MEYDTDMVQLLDSTNWPNLRKILDILTHMYNKNQQNAHYLH